MPVCAWHLSTERTGTRSAGSWSADSTMSASSARSISAPFSTIVRPLVVLTSNRARDLSEALRRRCLHVFVDFPGPAVEAEIVARKVPGFDAAAALHVARFVAGLRKLELKKSPSIAETLDWARALVALDIRELEPAAVRSTLGLLLKHEEDVRKAEPKVSALLSQA